MNASTPSSPIYYYSSRSVSHMSTIYIALVVSVSHMPTSYQEQYSSSGCEKREAHKNWFIVMPETKRQHPLLDLVYLEDYCAGGLSAYFFYLI